METLNLDFVDLGQLEGDTEVCLMPCPCAQGAGDYYPYRTTFAGRGGTPCDVLQNVLGDLLSPKELNEPENCILAIKDECAKYGIPEDECKGLADCACLNKCGTNAANTGGGGGGGGGGSK